MPIFFLIGFMGAGKSYRGRQWAAAAGWRFVELDALLEVEAGKPIARIFAEEGEAYFRQRESALLKTCGGGQPTVVATGGGTPCFFDNMAWMNSHGTTIYLKASPALLAQRLQPEKEQRPLLHGIGDHELEQFIAQKLADREPFYNQAEIVVDAGAAHGELLLGDVAVKW
jgi:shikimate kinase